MFTNAPMFPKAMWEGIYSRAHRTPLTVALVAKKELKLHLKIFLLLFINSPDYTISYLFEIRYFVEKSFRIWKYERAEKYNRNSDQGKDDGGKGI